MTYPHSRAVEDLNSEAVRIVRTRRLGFATAYLAHASTRLITGETLSIDGGYPIIDKGKPGTGLQILDRAHASQLRRSTTTVNHDQASEG